MTKKYAAIIFLGVVILTLFGLILVLSASSTYSYFVFDSVFELFNSHFFKVLLGLFFLILFAYLPYEVYKNYSKILIIIAIMLLFYTLLFAISIKGAGRWINLGFISFQPADFAKLVLIIHLAYLIESKNEIIKNFKYGFLIPTAWIILTSGLIFLQPNVSNAALILIIGFSMLYVGGAKFTHILSACGSLAILAFSSAMIMEHSRQRLLSFWEGITTDGSINLQVTQAIYGLGSGGLYGIGIGNSKQSNLFLPESYGDFIFAVLGEETGFIGALTALIIYLTVFLCGIIVAMKAKDKFGQLLAFGISFSFIISALVNAGVATGLMPTTGLPLPFISYGGTSILFLSTSIGILINIALTNHQPELLPEQVNV